MDIPPGLIDSAAILRTQAGTDLIHREFRSGKLVRIRRGFYVRTTEWVEAQPSDRFAWSTAAVARSVKGAVLCGETAALAAGLPTLRTPLCVELATTLPGRSGIRRSPFLVLGDEDAAKEARTKRSYPLRYRLKAPGESALYGEFRCSPLLQTALDVMLSSPLSEAMVVADGVARRLHADGAISAGSSLLDVPELRQVSPPIRMPRSDAGQNWWRAWPVHSLSRQASPTAGQPSSSSASSNRSSARVQRPPGIYRQERFLVARAADCRGVRRQGQVRRRRCAWPDHGGGGRLSGKTPRGPHPWAGVWLRPLELGGCG